MIEAIHEIVKRENIGFLYCSFVEMSGIPKAKLVPTTHLEETGTDGAGFAGFACGEVGQGPGDPDLVSIPDFRSFTVLPWRKGFAWVAGDLQVRRQPWPYCPRSILRAQIDRAQRLGFRMNVGVEPEFMLLKQQDGDYVPGDSLDSLVKPCYDLNTLNRNIDLITTLLGCMQALGWEPFAADHEDANGQYELNWNYSDALTTADRAVFFRWMVRTLAEQHGLHATFAPKPFSHLTGNGCHYHLSLQHIETCKNVFLDREDSLGLSATARYFLGGLLKHARALSAVTSPIVNSYKRLIRHSPDSGATWAPVFVTYGSANRTQMVRVPGPGRIENRTPDGAANPYLASAAMLAAGLDGIENKIDPGAANEADLYAASEASLQQQKIQCLPGTLSEALDEFEKDDTLCHALGKDYAAYYIKVKRREWEEYHRYVDQWERKRYLKLY